MRKKDFIRATISMLTLISLPLLWLVLNSAWLKALSPNGDFDSSRIFTATFVYGVLLNVVLWVPALWRKYRMQLMMSLITVCVLLWIIHSLLPVAVPALGCPRYRSVFSPDLQHVLPPMEKMYEGRYEGKDVFVETNEDGLRTGYTREQFAKMRIRILILGDSFAFGLGVQQPSTWPELLQARLRKEFACEDIGVLNAGVISYSPILEAKQYERLSQYYKPNLVILLLDPTDIGDDYHYSKERDTRGGYRGIIESTRLPHGIWAMSERFREKMGSALLYPYDFLASHLFHKKKAPSYNYYDFSAEVKGVVEKSRFFIYRYPLADTRSYFNFTFSNIVSIAEACRKNDARFLLALEPRFQHWSARECPKNWESGEYGPDDTYKYEFFRYFEQREREQRFPVISLLPAFQATKEYPLVFANDPHWNEHGHDFVARVMASYLLTNKLILPRSHEDK